MTAGRSYRTLPTEKRILRSILQKYPPTLHLNMQMEQIDSEETVAGHYYKLQPTKMDPLTFIQSKLLELRRKKSDIDPVTKDNSDKHLGMNKSSVGSKKQKQGSNPKNQIEIEPDSEINWTIDEAKICKIMWQEKLRENIIIPIGVRNTTLGLSSAIQLLIVQAESQQYLAFEFRNNYFTYGARPFRTKHSPIFLTTVMEQIMQHI
ncbi:MAG: hypothetical protein EZS28_029188 [Streblomastix strix]|uniref:Uncharacterized protein n=1 Tax=Streblomastix strix TaxID=222440 RepID=A0A5J4UYG4_9EUKA|nr:MAG: hypothetical protein EZS28_029188 [Streblomastix strix]